MDTIAGPDLIPKLRARLGERGVLTDPADTAPYCEDWRRLYRGRTPAVLRPATTQEVADAVRLCAARRRADRAAGRQYQHGRRRRGQRGRLADRAEPVAPEPGARHRPAST